MTEAQQKLDAAAGAILEAVGNVRTEIQTLKDSAAAGQTPLDFSGLDAAVGELNQSTEAVESGEPAPNQDLPGAGA